MRNTEKAVESKTLHDKTLASSYWLRRQRDPRVFCLVFTVINLPNYIATLSNPEMDQLAISYEIGLSVAAILMLALPYWFARLQFLIRFGFMLALLTLQIFIFDFAGRRELLEEQGWHITVNFMLCFSIVGLFFHFYSFSHDQLGHLSFGVLYINLIYLSILSGVYPLGEIFSNYKYEILFYLAFAQLTTVALIRSQASHTYYLEYLFQFIQNQSFLSLVLNTMESGIIIIDENKAVTYANPQFKQTFSAFVKDGEAGEGEQGSKKGCCGRQKKSSRDALFSGHESILSSSDHFLPQLYTSSIFRKFRGSGHRDQELSPEEYSFNDLITMKDAMNDQIFELVKPGAEENGGLFETEGNLLASQTSSFYQIKFTTLIFREHERLMIKLTDVSDSVHYDQSKERNELLSLINATISHELRNPLNSIIAENTAKEVLYERMTEVVEDLFKGEAPSFERLQTLKGSLAKLGEGLQVQDSSAKLMNFLIHDFLDYAQIKSNSFRTKIAKFNIVDTIRNVMSIQKKKAEEQRLQFQAIFKNISQDEEFLEMPSVSVFSPMIYADQQRIMQALLNLQSNALKFTKQGSVLITAEILEASGQRTLKISVIDTGVGVPVEDQDKLFKLFGFVQNTQQYNQNGIGLGLVISEQIVNKFGGIIDFKSVPAPEPNHGSTFSFTIPLKSPEEEIATIQKLEEGYTSPSMKELNSKKLDFSWRPEDSVQQTQQNLIADPVESPAMLSPPSRTRVVASVFRFSSKKKLHLGRGDSLSSFESEREIELCETEGRASIFNQDFDRIISNKMNGFDQESDSSIQKSCRILIVDDQSFNITALKTILEFKLGVAPDLCDQAFNGMEAVEAVKDLFTNHGQPYALILMDCNMPFMDGYEASLAIRHFYLEEGGLSLAQQPIITAVTGHSESQYVKKCFESGMNQVLSKPVDSSALAEACKQAQVKMLK